MNVFRYRVRHCSNFHCVNIRRFCSNSHGDDKNSKPVLKKSTVNTVDTQASKARFQTHEASQSNDKKEAAKNKLLSLLSELKVDSGGEKRGQTTLNLARAVKRPLKKDRFKEIIEEKSGNAEEKKIQKAAEEAALSVKGDPKKTLAELNEKLRALQLAKSQEKIEENVIEEDVLDQDITKQLMSSVGKVAATVPQQPVAKSELTQRLIRLSAEDKGAGPTKKHIEDIMKQIKIKTEPRPTKEERTMKEGFQISRTASIRQPLPTSQERRKINIFDAKPLDIFDVSETPRTELSVWQRLESKHLQQMVQFAPTNGFEEMIMWTEQGKHWKFPIDNETEMGDEEKVGFHEHVFLEPHLDGFPTKGPVRHFMELVCVGLSKNPYITAERKRENIQWFRDYFRDKEDVLREAGVLL